MPISIAGSGAVTGASTLNGLTVPTDTIAPALVLITSQSFTAAGAVSINNCFKSTYQNYRLVFSGTASTGGDIRIKFRFSGTDSSAGYYFQYMAGQSTTLSGMRTSNVTTGIVLSYLDSTGGGGSVEVYSPAEAVKTYTSSSSAYYGSSITSIMYNGFHDSSVAYDGITISHSGGTWTGNVRVYGYRNTP